MDQKKDCGILSFVATYPFGLYIRSTEPETRLYLRAMISPIYVDVMISMRLFPHKSIGELTHICCLYSQPEEWRVDMTYREQPNGNLAVLLCALSFARGLGLSERMEYGLNSAYFGLRLADNARSPERGAGSHLYINSEHFLRSRFFSYGYIQSLCPMISQDEVHIYYCY